MKELNRGRALRVLIPFFVAVPFALPGCGGSTDDLSRTQSQGKALKTPSEVLKEANAQAGIPEKEPGKAVPGKKGHK